MYVYFFSLIALTVAVIVVKSNSTVTKNELYNFEQKCEVKKIILSDYKKYEFDANDNLKQCAEKLILLKRCVEANYTTKMHDVLYRNYQAAFKNYPNVPFIAANFSFLQQLTKGNVTKSLPILLPFIQESANYPAIPEAIYKILNDAYYCETSERDMITFLGDNDYKAGREKLELLCNYWYSKLDSNYTGCSPGSISYARNQMTGQKQQEAIAVWKKLLSYINKSQPN